MKATSCLLGLLLLSGCQPLTGTKTVPIMCQVWSANEVFPPSRMDTPESAKLLGEFYNVWTKLCGGGRSSPQELPLPPHRELVHREV